MHTHTENQPIKNLLIRIAYVCVVLLVLEGCQGCHRGAISPSLGKENPDPGGIPNLGNTCYMNAVLQIIAKLYPGVFDGKAGPLVAAGRAIVDKIEDDQDYMTEAEAEAFYTALLDSKNGKLTRGRQEDAEECLMVLLQNSVTQPYSIRTKMISFNKERTIHNYGGWREQVVHDSTPLKIALPDNDNVTMQECLEHEFRDEDFVGENQYQDAYIGLVDAIRQVRLAINSNSNAPLVVHLLRFTNAEGKNTKDVTGTLCLTVPAGVQYSPNRNAGDLNYLLQGFIVHSGSDSIHSGHYMAYINRSGQWKRYNDARVQKVTPEEAAQAAAQAYLYFYKTP